MHTILYITTIRFQSLAYYQSLTENPLQRGISWPQAITLAGVPTHVKPTVLQESSMGPGLSAIYKVRRLTYSRICITSKKSGSPFQTVLGYQVAIRPPKVQSKAGRSHLNPAGGYDFSRARGAHRHRAAWKWVVTGIRCWTYIVNYLNRIKTCIYRTKIKWNFLGDNLRNRQRQWTVLIL